MSNYKEKPRGGISEPRLVEVDKGLFEGLGFEFEAKLPDEFVGRYQEGFLEMEQSIVASLDRYLGSEWREKTNRWVIGELGERGGRIDYVLPIPRAALGQVGELVDGLNREGFGVGCLSVKKVNYDMGRMLAGEIQRESGYKKFYQGEFGLVLQAGGRWKSGCVFVPWQLWEGGMVTDRMTSRVHKVWENLPECWGDGECVGMIVDDTMASGRTMVGVWEGMKEAGARVDVVVANVAVGTGGLEVLGERIGRAAMDEGIGKVCVVPVPVAVSRVAGFRYQAWIGTPLVFEW